MGEISKGEAKKIRKEPKGKRVRRKKKGKSQVDFSNPRKKRRRLGGDCGRKKIRPEGERDVQGIFNKPPKEEKSTEYTCFKRVKVVKRGLRGGNGKGGGGGGIIGKKISRRKQRDQDFFLRTM